MKCLNRRTRVLLLTLFLGIVLIVIYLLGTAISEEALKGSILNARRPPSLTHPFGTDALGRDLLLRTLKGLTVSITVGSFASCVSGMVAILAGMASAIGSKRVDSAINWIIDLVMGIPHTILIILISFLMGRGLKGLMIGIAATHWCSLARLIRAEVIQLRTQQYVTLSRRLGKKGGWILIHHMLPHLIPQFFTGLILMFPHAILHEATISFLGFGLSPEQPAIGIILSESMAYLSTGMWWSAVFPGAALVLLVLLIDKLGENIRIILDPYSAQE